MRICQFTPGSGGNFYCENCLRDNAVIPAMQARGHDVMLVPLYLPVSMDAVADTTTPVFFGGVNVWLQQHSAFFRWLPRWLDRALDQTWLLRLAARFSGMTNARDLGKTLISMLEGPDGNQAKEIDRLVEYMTQVEKPDVLVLSSVLLAGMAPTLKERLKIPIVCILQGEGGFIDSFPEDLRDTAWQRLKDRARSIDRFIAVSDWYRTHMGPRMDVSLDRIGVVHVGLDATPYLQDPAPSAPTIGYLSRLCPERGFDLVVDAFLQLKPQHPNLRLLANGGSLPVDQQFIRRQLDRVKNFAGDVTILNDLSPKGRADFMRRCTLLSVPERMPEGYGLFLIEAAASAVPVVQPAIGPYPEILALTEGGLSCPVQDLAQGMDTLLRDPARATAMGQTGRKNALERCSLAVMALQLEQEYQLIV